MIALLLRHIVLLALAFAVSWWIVFADPPQVVPRPAPAPNEIQVALEDIAAYVDASAPAVDSSPSTSPPVPASGEEETLPALPAEESIPKEAPEEDSEEEVPPAPAPPELGSPEAEEQDQPKAGDDSDEASDKEAGPQSETTDSTVSTETSALMADPKLLAAAALEVEGKGRKGFTTELIAAPEDQLEIARSFGEELVLIPYRSVAPDSPDRSWYRISGAATPKVERVSTPPPLSNYRQYRDLFDYEYSQLPPPLRELRRAVLSRNEVYLFAALIPQQEWALVIGRRQQALKRSGRSQDEVQTFRIRYRKKTDGSFDVEVIEIIFSDGSRFRPSDGVKEFATKAGSHSPSTQNSQ